MDDKQWISGWARLSTQIFIHFSIFHLYYMVRYVFVSMVSFVFLNYLTRAFFKAFRNSLVAKVDVALGEDQIVVVLILDMVVEGDAAGIRILLWILITDLWMDIGLQEGHVSARFKIRRIHLKQCDPFCVMLQGNNN